MKSDLVSKILSKSSIGSNINNFTCNYDHSMNPFDMSHKLNGVIKINDKDIKFDVNFESSLFSLYDFKKLNIKLCSGKDVLKLKVVGKTEKE